MECGCEIVIDYGDAVGSGGKPGRITGARVPYGEHPRETVSYCTVAVALHLARVAKAYEADNEREMIDALESLANAATGFRDAVYEELHVDTVRIGG